MLHIEVKFGENKTPPLQGPVWAQLKSIHQGRTTGVQTNHFSLGLTSALYYIHLASIQLLGSYPHFPEVSTGSASWVGSN